MLKGDHTFLLHMMRPSHWVSPLHDRSFAAERERRGIRDREHSPQRRTFMPGRSHRSAWKPHALLPPRGPEGMDLCDFTGTGSSSGYCSPPSQQNINVPSTFPCSGQCVVALSTATGVSFSLFTHPAFVKMPWENRNVDGSSATEVDEEFTSDLVPWTLKWTPLTMQHTETNVFSHPPSLFGALGGHGGWVRGGGYRGPRSNPPTLHERQELFGNLCQDVLRQSSHAEHLVPWVVDVVTERNKLNENRISPSQKSAGTFGGKLKFSFTVSHNLKKILHLLLSFNIWWQLQKVLVITWSRGFHTWTMSLSAKRPLEDTRTSSPSSSSIAADIVINKTRKQPSM